MSSFSLDVDHSLSKKYPEEDEEPPSKPPVQSRQESADFKFASTAMLATRSVLRPHISALSRDIMVYLCCYMDCSSLAVFATVSKDIHVLLSAPDNNYLVWSFRCIREPLNVRNAIGFLVPEPFFDPSSIFQVTLKDIRRRRTDAPAVHPSGRSWQAVVVEQQTTPVPCRRDRCSAKFTLLNRSKTKCVDGGLHNYDEADFFSQVRLEQHLKKTAAVYDEIQKRVQRGADKALPASSFMLDFSRMANADVAMLFDGPAASDQPEKPRSSEHKDVKAGPASTVKESKASAVESKGPPGGATPSGEWQCGACTYINAAARRACEMCGCSKPGTGGAVSKPARTDLGPDQEWDTS